MIKSTFELEKKLINAGYKWVIGIDEAGRGPLAGPVVAAAALLKCHAEFSSASNSSEILKPSNSAGKQVQDDKLVDLIRDSKTLSEKQRESLFDFINKHFFVGVGICNHETIDRMNILEATYLAAKKSLSDLFEKINKDTRNNNQENPKQISNQKIQNERIVILFDGNKNITNISIDQKAIVSGDKLIKSISAASIIAKVTRDRIMLKMHEKYPDYGFDKHKGYGTKLHIEMLKQYGPSEIHRRSFRPVSQFAKKQH